MLGKTRVTELEVYREFHQFLRVGHLYDSLTTLHQVLATMLGSVLTQPFANVYKQLSCGLHSVVKEFEFGVSH